MRTGLWGLRWAIVFAIALLAANAALVEGAAPGRRPTPTPRRTAPAGRSAARPAAPPSARPAAKPAIKPVAQPAVRAVTPTPRPRERPVVPFEVVFQELRTEGQWGRLHDGRWAWQPAGLAPDWRPFSRGSWVLTEAVGWFWLADEPWGWVTAHYGRWERHAKIGWVWAPGAEWSPARVEWRVGTAGAAWGPEPPDVPTTATADGSSWTYLPWANLSRALAAHSRAGAATETGWMILAASTTTVTAAPPAGFLGAAERAAPLAPEAAGGARMAGPSPEEIGRKIGRRPRAVPLLDVHIAREALVFTGDGAFLAAYRPVFKESEEAIQAFLAEIAERYRKMSGKP